MHKKMVTRGGCHFVSASGDTQSSTELDTIPYYGFLRKIDIAVRCSYFLCISLMMLVITGKQDEILREKAMVSLSCLCWKRNI